MSVPVSVPVSGPARQHVAMGSRLSHPITNTLIWIHP
jgi:hypothetical protein